MLDIPWNGARFLLRRFPVAFLLLFLGFCFSGCSSSSSNSEDPTKKLPFVGVKLRLLVLDDPALAKAIEQSRDEWNAQSGSDLEILQNRPGESPDFESLDADIVLGSSYQFARFAEKKLLAELPNSVVKSKSWLGVFELPKIREAAWGEKLYGIPFGSPVFTVYYRADLLKKIDRLPPKTWTEYFEIAQLLASAQKSSPESPWYGELEPLSPGWAGLTLLARAAPVAKNRNNYSTWFDMETMEPLIDGPPLVESLKKLVEIANINGGASLQFDPASVRQAFDEGKCGLAITWPSASETSSSSETAKVSQEKSVKIGKESGDSEGKDLDIEVGFVELPGSRQVFNSSSKKWEVRQEEEQQTVPFLGLAGRIGAVSAKSSAQEAGFSFWLWLSDRQISPRSAATTLFRKSHLEKPQLWTEKGVRASASRYAELTAATLDKDSAWIDFRIPGREEYLAALDEAVQSAVVKKYPPAEALRRAAETWRKITEKYGKDRQKAAYLHSLGLE